MKRMEHFRTLYGAAGTWLRDRADDLLLAAVAAATLFILLAAIRWYAGRPEKAVLRVEPFQVANPAAVPAAPEASVVASRYGTRYYRPDCTGASRIKPENIVTFASIAEAENAGYSPAVSCPQRP